MDVASARRCCSVAACHEPEMRVSLTSCCHGFFKSLVKKQICVTCHGCNSFKFTTKEGRQTKMNLNKQNYAQVHKKKSRFSPGRYSRSFSLTRSGVLSPMTGARGVHHFARCLCLSILFDKSQHMEKCGSWRWWYCFQQHIYCVQERQSFGAGRSRCSSHV